MFGMFAHYSKPNLLAYAHGEMPSASADEVASHLNSCATCRKAFEEIRLGVRLAESLTPVTAPASLWDGIERSLDRQQANSSRERAPGPRSRFFGFSPFWTRVGATAVAAMVLLAVASWIYFAPSRSGWEISRLTGNITTTGRLTVGGWLETDSESSVQLKVANIGHVDVDPNTRVRLIETGVTEHRLELARGRMHAKIWAPPRLFFVNTPSAVAADLGCAYTLEVDDRGRSILHVTSGWVALEAAPRESFVPAGAACLSQPGSGPGTPYFEDASPTLIDALKKFDFENGGDQSLETVVANSRERDTLTLWHLISRVNESRRAAIYDRMAELAPPPDGVTREGILALDRAMLDNWKDQLEYTWMFENMPLLKKSLRKMVSK